VIGQFFQGHFGDAVQATRVVFCKGGGGQGEEHGDFNADLPATLRVAMRAGAQPRIHRGGRTQRSAAHLDCYDSASCAAAKV